ncbi:MAG: phosphoadenosine phosphosulfate reductase domain-containing protein [Candidatus Helarchaeota archaeon]
MTNPVFFGPNILKWCDNCNIPILNVKKCPKCNEETRSVNITPPFDVRPAIFGIDILKNTIDSNYGVGSSSFLDSKIVLFNRAPDIDTLDEVILDGVVVGRLQFDVKRMSWRFKPTINGALRIFKVLKRFPKWVLVDKGAEPYIKNGANVLAPGILDFDNTIEKLDFVFIINTNNQLLAIGKCKYSPKEIRGMKKGMIIKNIGHIKETYNLKDLKKGATWEDVINANWQYLEEKENTSKKLLRRVVNKYNEIPVAVSFSGGKDSLCTLLIAIEELKDNFHVIFLNTGIEFPETVRFTKEIIRRLGLESKLIIGDAKNTFWENLSKYGFPARDYRWCNKVLKLDIMKKIIEERFNGKALTVVGTRKRESRTRSREREVSQNKNIPGQINVSIIHNWTTLTVWLYIIKKGIKFNPIYNNNFNRIGCWICPSNKLSEIETLKSTHPRLYEKLMQELKKFKEEINASEEFIKYGFWRWRNPSKGMVKLAKKLKIPLDIDYSRFQKFNW